MPSPLLRIIPVALLAVVVATISPGVAAAPPPLSAATKDCIGCHEEATPGIVADWRRSRHAQTTVRAALRLPEARRRVSVTRPPAGLSDVAVGCAECHTQRPKTHRDSFPHGDHKVHIVVSPADCATCHPTERAEYDRNLMSHAYGNLKRNPLHHALLDETAGALRFEQGRLVSGPPDPQTQASACLSCHGTKVEVTGRRVKRNTDFGELEFPVLEGWPNQGVGRINPDGTRGSCTACHTRHQFSVAVARQPATCAECHTGPDVPAFKVYSVSKHGALYASLGREWDFSSVPWVPGKHFTAPTCAACHISLLANEKDQPLVKRTHMMSDRLPYRLFGLPYAHPHPRSPDTSGIVNRAGLRLPTELSGEPVQRFVIDPREMSKRQGVLQSVCKLCHSTTWTEGHFARLDTAVKTTNALTLASTKIVQRAWDLGLARGPAQKDSPFNEPIERRWVEQWLFYANSIRLAAAMSGADYGTFANGRWYATRNLREMQEWLEHAAAAKAKAKAGPQ